MSGAVGESVGSAVDAQPHHPPTRTVIELREPLLTDKVLATHKLAAELLIRQLNYTITH